MNKAVFLDRDGIINKAIIKDGKAYSPRRFSEFKNQPDIARGNMDISELNKMTETIKANLAVDEISICPHDDTDNCTCRKPKPGMLFDAAKKYEINLNKSFLVGDGWKDMEAAKNTGCMGILIDTFYNKGVDCFRRVEDMNGAVNIILNEKEES